jgi:hypothetical protein
LTWLFLAELGGSPVLVDHTADDSASSNRGIERDHAGRVVVGWVLIGFGAAVVIEVALVKVQDGDGVPVVKSTAGRRTPRGRYKRTVRRSSSSEASAEDLLNQIPTFDSRKDP